MRSSGFQHESRFHRTFHAHGLHVSNPCGPQAEIGALRHQIAVLQRSAPRRLRLKQSDRFLWILYSSVWPQWRRWLRILKPDTVIRWHRRAFARYWTRKSRRRPGRPAVAVSVRDLIRRMSQANRLWGAPRIHGELSNWESKWRHRRSVSICGERANHPRRRGERSSQIT